MQHMARAGGLGGMQVDHFDPREKRKKTQRYSNLHLATAHCNRAKSDSWPNGEARRAQCRFLDCCREQDYGVHIFEDPNTHELVGATPAGVYHIEKCDLNAPHFVEERRKRSRYAALLMETAASWSGAGAPWADGDGQSKFLRLVSALRSEIQIMIPSIAPPPKETCVVPDGSSAATS
jgi:hypothetical protein